MFLRRVRPDLPQRRKIDGRGRAVLVAAVMFLHRVRPDRPQRRKIGGRRRPRSPPQ
jgi:hypothetical protein